MSIAFDTEKWSSPQEAWDFLEGPRRPRSPRIVSLADLPYFRTRVDIEGEAAFRMFTCLDDDFGLEQSRQKDPSREKG